MLVMLPLRTMQSWQHGWQTVADESTEVDKLADMRRLHLQKSEEHVAALAAELEESQRGLAGLRHAQAVARGFLAAGGAAQPDALARAAAIGRDFVARRLSPGGAADTLAAACWLQRLADL